MLGQLFNKFISLPLNAFICSQKGNNHLRGLTFVAVIFDDWHGLHHPIGIVHEMMMPNGQKREIFTFCGKGARQPEIALFVKKRSGNLASGLVLNHDEIDRVPAFLKTLPDDYKEAHFAGQNDMELAIAC